MRVVSWNIRGLALKSSKGRRKWETIVNSDDFKGAIVLLQELKIIEEDVGYVKWLCDQKGLDVEISCNLYRSRGGAVIAPRKFGIRLVEKDEGTGRRVTVKCNEAGENCYITCIYAPDNHKEKREWLSKLKVPKG